MSLQRYLNDRYGGPPERHPSTLGRVGRRVLPEQLRLPAKLAATKALRVLEQRKARRLEAEVMPLRLHLGCGTTLLPGWVNVDLVGVGSGADLFWDLLKSLPFSDNVVEAILHEHVMEHFGYADALRLTKECARVLKPGGVLRIGVPDFRSYARSYVDGGTYIEQVRGGRPVPLLAVAEIVYDHGHSSIWDTETMEVLFAEAGLAPCKTPELGTAFDSPARQAETLYGEAKKQ